MGKSSQRGSVAKNSGFPNRPQSTNYRFAIVCVAVILGFAVLVYSINLFGWFQGGDKVAEQAGNLDGKNKAESKPAADSKAKLPNEGREGWVKVGGVWRPKSDVERLDLQRRMKGDKPPQQERDPLSRVGMTPTVNADANTHTKTLFAALNDPKQTVSVLTPVGEFKLDEYRKAPQAYLSQTVPRRAFTPAKPAKGVRQIRPVSSQFNTILQGETIALRVEGTPNVPVTFHTPDLGAFDNRLKTMSVETNEEGIAEVNYTATTGVVGLVNVAAASPVDSEIARFIVNVELPEPIPAGNGGSAVTDEVSSSTETPVGTQEQAAK